MTITSPRAPAVFLCCLFLAGGCSSDGGHDQDPPADPAAPSAAMAARATALSSKGVKLALELAIAQMEVTAPLALAAPAPQAEFGKSPLFSPVRVPRPRVLEGASALVDLSESLCPDGGRATQDTETDTLTYESCARRVSEEVDGVVVEVRILRNGSVTAHLGDEGFLYRSVGFRETITRVFDGLVFSSYEEDLFLRGSVVEGQLCLGVALPRAVEVEIQGGSTLQRDEKPADGNADVHKRGDLDLRAKLLLDLDPGTCQVEQARLLPAGRISFENRLDSRQDLVFQATEGAFEMGLSAGTEGTANVAISGKLEIESECFNGELHVESVRDLTLPAEGSDCPVGGEIVVTGSAAGTLVFREGGGVEVDEGSDGDVDRVYSSCDDVDSCRLP